MEGRRREEKGQSSCFALKRKLGAFGCFMVIRQTFAYIRHFTFSALCLSNYVFQLALYFCHFNDFIKMILFYFLHSKYMLQLYVCHFKLETCISIGLLNETNLNLTFISDLYQTNRDCTTKKRSTINYYLKHIGLRPYTLTSTARIRYDNVCFYLSIE